MPNIFQEIAEAFAIFAELEADAQQLTSVPPNTPTPVNWPAGKIIKGIARINGKRVDLVGVVLQVEP